MYRSFGFLLAAALLLSYVGDASANIILNPSFEAGQGTDADDWLELGGPSGSTTRDGSMPNTGSFSAYMQVDHFINPAAATPYSVEQTQPVGSINNAENYNLSFSAKVDTLNFESLDMFYQILWLDQDASDGGGVRGESLIPLIPAGISTSYQMFGLSDMDVPDGTDSFQLRFQLSPGAVENIGNGLYIDDVVLASTSSQSTGDFDEDGDVDGHDFLLWQRTQGTMTELNDWQTTYGSVSGTFAAAAIVPEPPALTLLLVSSLLLFQLRDRARDLAGSTPSHPLQTCTR